LNSKDDQKQILNHVGEKILTAMDEVAQAAQRALSEAPSRISTSALIHPSNLMVGEAEPERRMQATNAEERASLRRLLDEPFVACVEVDWGLEGRPSVQTFYFPRRSAAGLGISGAAFVTSGAPLGRLAEYEAGETAHIDVSGRERVGRILKRTVLSPRRQEGLWDALIRNFEATPWGDLLELLRHESLRRTLADIKGERAGPLAEEDIVGQLLKEAAHAASEQLRLRRKVVDRIALRDQPILDKFQGEIFRLPLDQQVILFGPAGSGKTTTLIKRLAQKRTPEALTEDERTLVSEYAPDTFARPDSWAMFSPAELLKQYLGEAFNQEGVPDAGNVRTWDKERHDLARNVLNILRSHNSGRFQLDDSLSLLIEPSSRGISNLHDEFATYAEANLLRRCNEALASLLSSSDENAKRQAIKLYRTRSSGKQLDLEDVLQLFDQADDLQVEIKRLNDQISAELNKIVNLLLNTHRKLLEETMLALPAIKAEEVEEEEEDTEETAQAVATPANARMQALNMIMSALRNWARAIAEGRRTIGGQSGRVIELIGERLPPDSQLSGIGANITTRSRLGTLVHAPRTLVLGVPAMYARFRRDAVREGRHFVSGETATAFLARGGITRDEVDVLLLVMLRNARRLCQYDGRRLVVATPHDWLESIKSRYLMQVFVDEATDFSAVQLACTVELAHPNLRSWFASGDLHQRITANGVQHVSEIAWLNNVAGISIDIRKIDIGYRQSQRLRDLSDALAVLLDPGSKAKTNAPRGSEEADVWPLLRENLLEAELAQWLAERIHEVERTIGRLPSIAVFVDGDDLIDPLLNATQGLLAEQNIPIVGCMEGRVAGDAREVRIFDIQHHCCPVDGEGRSGMG
jgi:hypothetical protein